MGYTFRPEEGTSLCREFGISRKTGYKILERFEHCGVEGLSDRARRPHRYANQLPAQVEAAIVAAKHENLIGERARSTSCCCVDFLRT
jgi:putative transposase